MKKVKEFQIEAVVSALCANMASENEQLRDISSIGLKTVINELPLTSNSLVEAVCKNITQRISSVILKVSGWIMVYRIGLLDRFCKTRIFFPFFTAGRHIGSVGSIRYSRRFTSEIRIEFVVLS